ncbi:hypothetical protein BaRGS_00019968, partial [Batillaria attramentaria]
ALVHVSTAYANCDHTHIEETVYTPSVEPQKVIDTLQWVDDETVEFLRRKLVKNKPNTYTYTKHLAEWVLLTEGAGLPIAIVRPSIVGATWKEPFPGWIDKFTGPSGMAVAIGKGLLRALKGDKNVVADLIPNDIPINIMITAAWYTAVVKPQKLMVYHAVTSPFNPVTWGQLQTGVLEAVKKTPMEGCFRLPVGPLIANRVIGREPRMLKIYSKLHQATDDLAFFIKNSWTLGH